MAQVVVHSAGGRGYVWNASDVKVLRETRRFIGALVGPNTGTTHQEHLPHSLPLLLMPEELQLGLKRGWFLIAPEPLPPAVLSQAPAQLPSPEELEQYFKQRESETTGENTPREPHGKRPHSGGPGNDSTGTNPVRETAAGVPDGASSGGERETTRNSNGTDGREDGDRATHGERVFEDSAVQVEATEGVPVREGAAESTEPAGVTGATEATESALSTAPVGPTESAEATEPTGGQESAAPTERPEPTELPEPTEAAVAERTGKEQPTKAGSINSSETEPTEVATRGGSFSEGLDVQENGAAILVAAVDETPPVSAAASRPEQGTKKKSNREEEYWLSFADASQRNVLMKQPDATNEATPGIPAPPEEETDRFLVFEDMYNRGYTITSGTNFGGNFLAYAGDPSDYHSEFVVRVTSEPSRIPYASLSAASRVALTARKKYLIALVVREAGFRKIQYVVIAPDLVTASGVNRGLKVLPWLQRKKA